jgi:hypothetical protein
MSSLERDDGHADSTARVECTMSRCIVVIKEEELRQRNEVDPAIFSSQPSILSNCSIRSFSSTVCIQPFLSLSLSSSSYVFATV